MFKFSQRESSDIAYTRFQLNDLLDDGNISAELKNFLCLNVILNDSSEKIQPEIRQLMTETYAQLEDLEYLHNMPESDIEAFKKHIFAEPELSLTANYIRNTKSKMPSPIKKNYDYGEIPNWIDRVKFEEKKREERKARIDIIVKRAVYSSIKFWISPEGKFHLWNANDYYESDKHHKDMVQEFSEGRFENNIEAMTYGWIRGGNINGKLYLDVSNIDVAIEALQRVPKEYRECDRIDLEDSGIGPIHTFGQDALLALVRYKRDEISPDKIYASMKISKRSEGFLVTAFVRKRGNKWCVISHKGKSLGCYSSKSKAEKRLRQIEFFKHQ